MDNIISLNQKLKHSAAQKAAMIRKQKIQSVRQFFQCAQCVSKCERCGTGIGLDFPSNKDEAPVPYHFCASCAQEYRAYIRELQGHSDPDTYWYNDEWLNLWRLWIDYQGAIDQYRRSKEFIRMINELRQDSHGLD